MEAFDATRDGGLDLSTDGDRELGRDLSPPGLTAAAARELNARFSSSQYKGCQMIEAFFDPKGL